MARQRTEMIMAVVLVVMLLGGATAQSSCNAGLISLSSCLTFVTGESSKPSSSCCSQLHNFIESQPKCLCALLKGGGSFGVAVDQDQVLALPGACKLETSNIGCDGTADGAATSPASSPRASKGMRGNSPVNVSVNVPDQNLTSLIPPSGSEEKEKEKEKESGGNIIRSSFDITVISLFLSALASILIKV